MQNCDREGENIGSEIVDVCQKVKPNICVYRAKFSEITFNSIKNALLNLETLDYNVIKAVDARQEFDLRIGASFTRFQTLRYQKLFPEALSEHLISYGSCQFPTLGLVVERYKQIENFIPEPFWKIFMSHLSTIDSQAKEVEFIWHRTKVFDHSVCLSLYSICMENPVAKIIDVKSKPKSKWRPTAMDTIALEKLASRKLKMTAKETMGVAEKLYQKGFISYPRTETNIFPKDLNLKSLVQAQTSDNAWGDFAQRILNDYGIHPRNGIKSDKAHPPIHPIKHHSAGLEGKEYQIYELVTRHFLACLSQDAKGHETAVTAEINDSESFTTKGLIVLERNYLDVYYPYESWNNKAVPHYQIGETFTPHTLEMRESVTKPPALLTEADLISLMEKHGIGTDATHAEHIETIKNRQYVGLVPISKQQYDVTRSEAFGDDDVEDDTAEPEINNNSNKNKNSRNKKGGTSAKSKQSQVMGFLPGKLGMGLVEGYNLTGYPLAKPQLRSELEKDLVAICDGTKDKESVLRYHLEKYKQIYKEVESKVNLMDRALAKYFGDPTISSNENADDTLLSYTSPPVRPCPACDSHMVIKKIPKKRSENVIGNRDNALFSYVLTCFNYPNCKANLWLSYHLVTNISVSDEAAFCDTCRPAQKFRLVTLTFDTKNMPPTLPRVYTTCLGGCDTLLTEFLSLKFNHLNKLAASSSAQTSPRLPNSIPSVNRGNSSLTHSKSYCTTSNSVGKSRADADVSDDNEDTNFDHNIEILNLRDVMNRKFIPPLTKFTNTNNNTGLQKNQSQVRRTDKVISNKATNLRKNNNQSHSPPRPAIKCHCGFEGLLLITKKGVNIGRSFYKCPTKTQSQQCTFFQWGEESSDGQPELAGGSGIRTHNQNSTAGGNQFSNTINSFIQNFQNDDNNFQQEEEEGPSVSYNGNFRHSLKKGPFTTTRSSFNRGTNCIEDNDVDHGDQTTTPMCNCNVKAVLRQVFKDGPNTGKYFYVCPKARDQQCTFFLWHTETLNNEKDVKHSNTSINNTSRTKNNFRAITTPENDDDIIICEPPNNNNSTTQSSIQSRQRLMRGIPPKFNNNFK